MNSSKNSNQLFKKKEVQEVQAYTLKDTEITKLSKSFVSPDEKYIASVGNGYIMNYLVNKTPKNGFAFITDKRVYFKGACFNITGKKITKVDEERTVDVKDITGSGFTYRGGEVTTLNILNILKSLLVAVPAVALLIILAYTLGQSGIADEIQKLTFSLLYGAFFGFALFMGKYLSTRKTYFRIEYAGGCIAFDASFYAKAEIDDFQKQLRRAKDLAEANSTVKAVATESPTNIPVQNNTADDLRKYAELLKDGLITQEEYDATKKKLLGL